MKNVASLFPEECREELKTHPGIELSDTYDYTEKELDVLYCQITDDFPYEFDQDGEPLRMGEIFENIIDVFAKNKLINVYR